MGNLGLLFTFNCCCWFVLVDNNFTCAPVTSLLLQFIITLFTSLTCSSPAHPHQSTHVSGSVCMIWGMWVPPKPAQKTGQNSIPGLSPPHIITEFTEHGVSAQDWTETNGKRAGLEPKKAVVVVDWRCFVKQTLSGMCSTWLPVRDWANVSI